MVMAGIAVFLVAVGAFTLLGGRPSSDPNELTSEERLQKLIEDEASSQKDAESEQANKVATTKQPGGSPTSSATTAPNITPSTKTPVRPNANATNSNPNIKPNVTPSTVPKTPTKKNPVNEDTTKITPTPKVVVKEDGTLTIGGLQWKILNVTSSPALSFEKDTDTAAGKFAVVEFEVKSVAQKVITIDTEWIYVVDANWTYYVNDIGAEGILQYQGKETLSYVDIAPGKTLKGFTVFDIPKDIKTFDLAIFDMDITTYDFGTIKATI